MAEKWTKGKLGRYFCRPVEKTKLKQQSSFVEDLHTDL